VSSSALSIDDCLTSKMTLTSVVGGNLFISHGNTLGVGDNFSGLVGGLSLVVDGGHNGLGSIVTGPLVIGVMSGNNWAIVSWDDVGNGNLSTLGGLGLMDVSLDSVSSVSGLISSNNVEPIA